MPILGPKVSGRNTNFLPSLIILSASSSESRPSWRKWSRKISVLIEVPWYRSLKYILYISRELARWLACQRFDRLRAPSSGFRTYQISSLLFGGRGTDGTFKCFQNSAQRTKIRALNLKTILGDFYNRWAPCLTQLLCYFLTLIKLMRN